MSRVARSARVGSRQRVEAITASKDLQSAETGELYLLDNSAGAIVITLPPKQDGAYFKFITSDDLVGLNTKTILIRSGANFAAGNGAIAGRSITVKTNGTVTIDGDGFAKPGNNHTQFTIAHGSDATKILYAGSEVEVYCDGTNWYLNAMLISDDVGVLGKYTGS